MFMIALFVITVVCLHVYERLITRRHRKMLAHLPTWPTLPFIGNAYKFLTDRDIYKHYENVSEIIETRNQPFVLWIGRYSVVVLTDPDEVRTVSNVSLNKAYVYTFMRNLFGDGLITARGSTWKHNVKKLGGAFRASNIEAFQDIFNAYSHLLVKNLEIEVNNEPFEMLHKYLTNITFEAVSKSTLGVSIEGKGGEDFSQAFIQTMNLFVNRTMNIYLHPEAIYHLTSAYKESEKSAAIVKNVTEAVLRQRVRSMEDKSDADDDGFDKTSKSFIEILLEMREADPTLTEEQIKYEVTNILLAGQESTATTLNYILLVLGFRHDIQKKLYDEIHSFFGDSGRPVCKEDLGRLTYCEAVISETLRLYPPAPGVLRYVNRDVQLKSCTIPKGSFCAFNIWGSGRSKHVWGPDALEFRPERWLDPSTASKQLFIVNVFQHRKADLHWATVRDQLLKTLLVHCLLNMNLPPKQRR